MLAINCERQTIHKFDEPHPKAPSIILLEESANERPVLILIFYYMYTSRKEHYFDQEYIAAAKYHTKSVSCGA